MSAADAAWTDRAGDGCCCGGSCCGGEGLLMTGPEIEVQFAEKEAVGGASARIAYTASAPVRIHQGKSRKHQVWSVTQWRRQEGLSRQPPPRGLVEGSPLHAKAPRTGAPKGVHDGHEPGVRICRHVERPGPGMGVICLRRKKGCGSVSGPSLAARFEARGTVLADLTCMRRRNFAGSASGESARRGKFGCS